MASLSTEQIQEQDEDFILTPLSKSDASERSEQKIARRANLHPSNEIKASHPSRLSSVQNLYGPGESMLLVDP